MASDADRDAPRESRFVAVGDMLDAHERLEFERLLQWLRLSFLIAPVLVFSAFGVSALKYALEIAAIVVLSFGWVELLIRYWPRTLLRIQLGLRILDCGLVYFALINYHAYLHNVYYEFVFTLFVVAAAATHGRRGAWLLSGVAGLATLIGRAQLIATHAMAYEPRQITDAIFYTLFFLVTSSVVAFLMAKTADVVIRRERAFTAELEERNVALAESIQLRDAMLAGVTHDLRTPITVVKVQAQLLRRRVDERHVPSLDQIERAATRMARWIDQMLEIATVHKPEDLDLTLREADLVKIVRESVEEQQASTSRHTIEFETSKERIVGEFDQPRLERALDNLIGNAVKYSPTGGCVEVSLAETDGWATVSVHDHGLGIPAADLPHVFEPFRRGGNVVGRISGTGIGLASAWRIVERHGGTLTAISEPGAGSTFTLRLPTRQGASGGDVGGDGVGQRRDHRGDGRAEQQQAGNRDDGDQRQQQRELGQ